MNVKKSTNNIKIDLDSFSECREDGKTCIKKYIFIITANFQLGINEFNFVNSIFTQNLDSMIKLQNYIYESINQFDSLDVGEAENYKNILTLFYYQLIIFIFKNISVYENSDNILTHQPVAHFGIYPNVDSL